MDSSRLFRDWGRLRSLRSGVGYGLLVVGFLVLGCRNKEVKNLPEAKLHILKMTSLWGQYRATHGKSPASTEQLTKWARSLKPDQLAKMGIENLDEALTSPRDHEPYQVTAGKPNRMGIAPVVVYEKTGVKDKHYALSSMGNAGEVSEEALKNSVPGYGQSK
jgi:hypothetical protein